MKSEETLQLLESESAKVLMKKLYGEDRAEENAGRYRDMIEKFREKYGDQDILMLFYIYNHNPNLHL